MPRGWLRFVIVVFPDHTYLLFSSDSCGTLLYRFLIFAFLFTFLPYFVYLAINLAILLTEISVNRRSLGGTPDAKSKASQLAE